MSQYVTHRVQKRVSLRCLPTQRPPTFVGLRGGSEASEKRGQVEGKALALLSARGGNRDIMDKTPQHCEEKLVSANIDQWRTKRSRHHATETDSRMTFGILAG